MGAETKKAWNGLLFQSESRMREIRTSGLLILFIIILPLLLLGWWLYKGHAWNVLEIGRHAWNVLEIGQTNVVGNWTEYASVGRTPLELHQLLYEEICMVQVSASVLTAGMAIAGPLYLSAWQSLSDSLFQALDRARGTLQNENVERAKRETLKKELSKAHCALNTLEGAVVEGRFKFRFALKSSAVLLAITIFSVAFPQENLMYVAVTATTLLSMGIGVLFILMIVEITRSSPLPAKLALQKAIAQAEYSARATNSVRIGLQGDEAASDQVVAAVAAASRVEPGGGSALP